MTRTQKAPDGRRVVEVALGVLIDRQNGVYLMGSRPEGKPYAGYWEFPGGKLEPHETLIEALKREFVEELGVELTDMTPWFVLEHSYEHAYVRLHYYRVWHWKGEFKARENQSFDWFKLGSIGQGLKMLPMNALVVNRMAVPVTLAAIDHPETFDNVQTLKNIGGLLILPEQKDDPDAVSQIKSLAQNLGLAVYTCTSFVKTPQEAAAEAMQEALFAIVRADDVEILKTGTQRVPLVIEADIGELETLIGQGAHGVFVRL